MRPNEHAGHRVCWRVGNGGGYRAFAAPAAEGLGPLKRRAAAAAGGAAAGAARQLLPLPRRTLVVRSCAFDPVSGRHRPVEVGTWRHPADAFFSAVPGELRWRRLGLRALLVEVHLRRTAPPLWVLPRALGELAAALATAGVPDTGSLAHALRGSGGGGGGGSDGEAGGSSVGSSRPRCETPGSPSSARRPFQSCAACSCLPKDLRGQAA